MLLKLNVGIGTEEMDEEMFIVVDGDAYPVKSREMIAEVLTKTMDVPFMEEKFNKSIDKKLDEVILEGIAYDASYLLSKVDPVGYAMAKTEYSVRKAHKVANKLQLYSIKPQGNKFTFMGKEYRLFDTIKTVYDLPEEQSKIVIIGCNEEMTEVYAVDMYEGHDSLCFADYPVYDDGRIYFQHAVLNIKDIENLL